MTWGTEPVRETLTWRWRHFTLRAGVAQSLELRTAIFVVEQECPYQEVDERYRQLASRGGGPRQIDWDVARAAAGSLL